MREIKAVIFDIDGTLIKLPINWDEVRSKVRKLLNTSHPLRPLATSIPEVVGDNLELLNRVFKVIEYEELKAIEKYDFSTKANVRKLFKCISSKGIKIGIVTLQGMKPATKILEKLDVKQYVSVLVTREFSVYRKEQLLAAINTLNVKPSEVVFVADSPWDEDAGKTIGCFTVIVGKRAIGDMNVNSVLELNGMFKCTF